MKSAKAAVATHLGWDMAELTDYIYQPSRFTKTVYALDFGYFCATKKDGKLPQPIGKHADRFDWAEIEDPLVNSYGWHIFKVEV